jgi:ligand-binding SRPBCC domain-containing protein
MQMTIRTKVDQPYLKVKEGFDEKLFTSLNPPYPKVKLQRFDGCRRGDVVKMQLQFGFADQRWESLITDDDTTNAYFFFQDEGIHLPFFLNSWKHQHWVKKTNEGTSEIVDHVHYSSGSVLTDLLLYPVMKAQFLYRQPVYRKIFS